MHEQQVVGRELSPAKLSFEEVLERWIRREGDRYVSLLVERGFLLPEDVTDSDKVKEATKDWRLTYVEDLNIDVREWKKETVEDVSRILEWRLGGWKGWLPYRPTNARVTTFKDVMTGLASVEQTAISEQHRTFFPEFARNITETLQTKDLFLLRCESDIAALDGTHTLVGLAYAIIHKLAVPKELVVYLCDFTEQERATFEAFCETRPLKYGRYHVT